MITSRLRELVLGPQADSGTRVAGLTDVPEESRFTRQPHKN